MTKKMPILALAQIKYNHTGRHNVEKIKEYIKLAAKKKADIVCFPETCINKAQKLPLNHKLIKEIQNTCKENSIWAIITDYFISNETHYKMAILINREGKIKGKYKKINLYGDETKESGKRILVKETDFGKIGIVICWDLAFPKLFKKMKKAGAEIVFCPAHWGYESKVHKENPKENEKNLLKSMLLSRAFENINFVSICNPYKKEWDLISYSAIASPHKILAELYDKEGLVISKVNLNEIPKFSNLYPGKNPEE
ncbi:carbon-nitrogen hydrolase family protein [Candidatus Pacearchaeota archaeon]|nr:carbon-nitrogen hydrolase family protein [Candidatus Pacearchaeota archaeon]